MGWDRMTMALLRCDAMRCVALCCDARAANVTCVGRGGMDLGWHEWDGAW